MNTGNSEKHGTKLSKTGSIIAVVVLVILAGVSLHYQSQSQYSLLRLNAASQILTIVPFLLLIIGFFAFSLYGKKKENFEDNANSNKNKKTLLENPVFWIGFVLVLMIGSFITSMNIASRQTNSNSKLVRFIGISQIIYKLIPFTIIFMFLLFVGYAYLKNKMDNKKK